MFDDHKNNIISRIADDEYRYYFQWCVINGILGLVSLFMTIINIATQKQMLIIATGMFSVVCFANLILLLYTRRVKLINIIAFQIAILALFTYFIVTGGAAGFSPHWILLMPACGMLLFGLKKGTVTSAILFGILVFFLWIPLGKSLLMYHYTTEFCMRFPVVYIAFFVIGAFFEIIRASAYKQMMKSQKQLTEIAEHDTLTQIHNRFWFYKAFGEVYETRTANDGTGMLLIDIDNFKSVNDHYGHDIGDQTLIAVSQGIASALRKEDLLCRWGGEEFLIFVNCVNQNALKKITDRIHDKMHSLKENCELPEGLTVTVSIGAVYIKKGLSISSDEIFSLADDAAYVAKNQGKDQTVLYNAEEHITA